MNCPCEPHRGYFIRHRPLSSIASETFFRKLNLFLFIYSISGKIKNWALSAIGYFLQEPFARTSLFELFTSLDPKSMPGNITFSTAESFPTLRKLVFSTGNITPTSGDSLPTWGDSFPTSGDSIPTPGDSSPTSGDSLPTPGDSSPTSGDSFPTSGDSFPTSGDLFPTWGDSFPTWGNALPTSGNTAPTTGNDIPTIQNSKSTYKADFVWFNEVGINMLALLKPFHSLLAERQA